MPDLKEPSPSVARDGTDFRLDIGLMQTVYAVLLGLGYRQLSEGTYGFIERDLPVDGVYVSIVAMGLGLLLLGFRFFWSVTSIRRHLAQAPHGEENAVRRRITTMLFPVLLLQGLAFYLLCRVHSDLAKPGLFEHRAHALAFSLSGFLFLNALWLWAVKLPTKGESPEGFWIKNNSWTAVVMLLGQIALPLAGVSDSTTLLFMSTALLSNCFLDLWKTAPIYSGGG